MTLNGVLVLILRYFTEFGSFRVALRKSGWRCRRKKSSRSLSHLLMSFLFELVNVGKSRLICARKHMCIMSKNVPTGPFWGVKSNKSSFIWLLLWQSTIGVVHAGLATIFMAFAKCAENCWCYLVNLVLICYYEHERQSDNLSSIIVTFAYVV